MVFVTYYFNLMNLDKKGLEFFILTIKTKFHEKTYYFEFRKSPTIF